uniref:Uncharacterized protein n=1 Tax=Anguilla anguilla TaxID=7936 RepID=A0A0E9Q9R6_ANGAN
MQHSLRRTPWRSLNQVYSNVAPFKCEKFDYREMCCAGCRAAIY